MKAKMEERIKKAIKQSEEIIKASGVSDKFVTTAYEVVLAYLLNLDKTMDKIDITDVRTVTPQPILAKTPSDWHSLVEGKQPENIYKLIALVVFYHTENQESGEQTNSNIISMEDIKSFLEKKCVDRIKNKDFDKLKRRIKDTSSVYKYIHSEGKGMYVLSPMGLKIIGQLPKKNAR